MNATAKIERIATVCRTIVSELVDFPQRVVVTPTLGKGGNSALMTVETDQSDFGKVIGKRGKNMEALRTLLEAIAAKHRMRLLIEIDDGQNGRRRSRP